MANFVRVKKPYIGDPEDESLYPFILGEGN